MPSDATPPRRTPPPSFTPQSGRPARPSARDVAIEVPDSGEQPQSPAPTSAPAAPVAPLSSNAPRPGASGRVPARVQRPPENPAAARPASVPPGRPTSRPGSAAAGDVPARSAASRTPTSGSGTPVSYAPASRTARPGATGASRTGAPAQPAAGRPAAQQPAAGRRVTSSPQARVASTPQARAGSGRPAGPPPSARKGHAAAAAGAPGPRRRPRWRRIVAVGLVVLLVCLVAWPVGLMLWANGKINHVEALSSAPSTPGTTYLLAGSDSRDDGSVVDDGTEGARTDTILVLHVPESGPSSLISLPRDSYAEIPGYGGNKLNAAYSFGGAPLLVQTVEGLTGMKVDHYVEIGLGGVEEIVDAVGGVELCLDYDVNDPKSELIWEAGCSLADGHTALAFSRMRYSDPLGDIGRAERQRQVISAVTTKLQDKSLLVKPLSQTALISSGLGAVTVDDSTNIVDMGKLALAFRNANGSEGITGTPPIATIDYRPGGVGSAVLLDPDLSPQFWTDIKNGTMAPGPVGGMP